MLRSRREELLLPGAPYCGKTMVTLAIYIQNWKKPEGHATGSYSHPQITLLLRCLSRAFTFITSVHHYVTRRHLPLYQHIFSYILYYTFFGN